MSSAKRKLAVGAAGLAVFAGAGGAYAATQQSSTPSKPPDPSAQEKAFLDDLAKRLNVTSDQLTDAIKGAASDQVDAAVAAGKLTKDQGDAIKKRIASANGLPLGGGGLRLGPPPGPGFGGRGPGPFGFGFGPGKSLSVAAKFLGLSDDALKTQLRDGKSLADIAKAQNKSTADLKAALKTAITSELDQMVKDKKITADQRARFEAGLDERLDNLIANTPPKDRPRIFGGRFRHP